MESYLVDKAVLGQFVDALISEKYPGQPAAIYDSSREDAIKALDHQILKSILGKLTKEQGGELNQLLDDENADPEVFEDFFKRNNVDINAAVEDTMVKFREEFLKGGANGQS